MATVDGSHVSGAADWRRGMKFQPLHGRSIPTGGWPFDSSPDRAPPPPAAGRPRGIVWPLVGIGATLIAAAVAILAAAHLPPRATAAAAALILVFGAASTAALLRRRYTEPSPTPSAQPLRSAPHTSLSHCTRPCPTPAAPELLNDLATACGSARSTDELLERCLGPLVGTIGARAAWVRLIDENGGLRLSAFTGVDPEFARDGKLCHECSGACWTASNTGEMRGQTGFDPCIQATGRAPLPDASDTALMAIPIPDGEGRTLGVYSLVIDQDRIACSESLRELLTRAGQHIGLSIQRLRDDRKARWVSINEERRLLAHELHDSVAQTLSALRMRIRQMEAAAGEPEDKRRLPAHMRRLRRDLDRSYRELRTLMGQFRGMVDGEGLHSALERLVLHLRRESAIEIRLLNDWEPDCLNGEQELQVLRIVQEALCNVRQHSGASNARVLLREQGPQLDILVEDDGSGFDPPRGGDRDDDTGYHMGLSGLEARAQRLGGVLEVESEPGEGTRVRVLFPRPGAEGSVPGHRQQGA